MRVDKDAAVPHQTFEVTVAILMVITAIIVVSVYPNFEDASNRGKQRRIMADIRTIARAVESYYADFKVYPSAKTTVEDIGDELKPYLENELPVKDEWGNKYLYRSDGSSYYTIISWGKDRTIDNTSIYQGLVTSYSNDIVFSNGVFVSFPEIIE